MAEGLNPIEQLIEIKFSTNKGMNPAEIAAAMETLRKQYGGLLKDVNKFTAALGDVDKATDSIVNGYRKQGKAAEDSFDKQKDGAKKAKVALSRLGSIISNVTGLMSKLGIPGLGISVKVALSLEKALLSASAGALRMGIGMTELESKMQNFSNTTKMTIKDVTELFDKYQMSMKFESMEGFEKSLERITGMVGGNQAEVEKYQSAISNLSQKFPELALALENMTEADAPGLRKRFETLKSIGELADDERKMLLKIVDGGQQISDEDQKIHKEKLRHIDDINRIKSEYEKIAIQITDAIMPALKAVATWMEKLKNSGINVGQVVVGIVASIAGLKALMSGMKFVNLLKVAGLIKGGGLAKVLGSSASGALSVGELMGKGILGKAAVIGAAIGAAVAGYKIGTKIWNAWDAHMEKNPEGASNRAFEAMGKASARMGELTSGKGEGRRINRKKIEELGLWDTSQKFASDEARDKAYKAYQKKRSAMRTEQGGRNRYVEAEKRRGTEAIEAKNLAIEAARVTEQKKINDLKQKEKELIKVTGTELDVMMIKAKELSSIYDEQAGLVSAIIANMAASGDIDMGKPRAAAEAAIATLDITHKKLTDINQIIASGDMSRVDELLSSEEINDSLKEKIKSLHEAGKLDVDTLKGLHREVGFQTMIEEIELKRKKILVGMIDVHAERIKLFELEVNRASKLIQIADNYAIGIGASAQMRMDLYDAEGQKIKELQRQLITNAAAMSLATNSAERNLFLANQRAEIENKILDSTLAQNQAVRAMRDGWVSAISAMNTGAGGFSEIIMNAEQNTAQLQRLEGAVRTSFSGAFNRYRGEDVGFRRSERFGVGGVGSIRGRTGGRQLAYLTQADRKMGIGLEGPSVLQHKARGTGQRVIKEMQAQGRVVRQGGGQALGAQHRMLVGSFVAGPGNVNGAAAPAAPATPAAPAKKREMLLGFRARAAEKATTIIPHAAAADITEPGVGAGVVNATVVMPNAQLNFTITNGQQLIDDGVEQMIEGIQSVTVTALNAG